MNLIEIVKRLPWPEGAVCVVQDCAVDGGGLLKYCSTDDVVTFRYFGEERSKLWATNKRPVDLVASALADDHDEAVITHADWLAAQEQVEPKERERGFYWVRPIGGGDWVVCWWDGYCFDGHHEAEYGPAEVEIDERRIVREP